MNPVSARLRREGEALADPLPALLVEAERVATAVALGVHGRRKAGVGESFWQYRQHRVEDGAAQIDWRRSARGDSLFVRENEWEAAQSVWLWRDGRAGMDFSSGNGTPIKKARASVLMIALASLLMRGGERVAVLGESAQPRSGRLGFDRAARRLADGPGRADNFHVSAVAAHGRVVLASDFFEPLETWSERVGRLAGAGVSGALVQIVDPAEEVFPYEGRVKFIAPDGGEELVIGRAQSIKEAYRQRFEAHRAGLKDIARRAGWTFASSRTDKPAAEPLLALYAALAPQRR